MAFVGQVQAPAPAAGRESREFGLIKMDLVARVGTVLSDQRIGRRADGEARLVEIGERLKRGDRLLPVVDLWPARVASGVARPGCRRDAAAVAAGLEQFVIGLERLPHALTGIAERSLAIGKAAAGGVGEGGPVERNERAPGEVGEGVALIGRRVLDAVRRNHRRDVGRPGPRQRGEARRDEQRGDGAGSPQRPHCPRPSHSQWRR